MKRLVLFGFIVVLLGLSIGTATAGELTNSFDFAVTLTAGCLITANTSLTLNYAITSDEVTGNFTVTHACTSGTAYTVRVGDGLNANGGVRRANKTTDYVKYRLYWDDTYSDQIGVSSNHEKTATGTGASAVRTIYAKVLKTDNPDPVFGAYTDTVRVSLIW